MMRLGFIGVGTIAEAVITGLRHKGVDNPILLSPRSEARSRRLSQTLSDVSRLGSNAEVVEASDVVFLGMLPPQLAPVLAGLPFRPAQLVVSFVANTPMARLAELVPGPDLVRMIPLPPIARARGPLVYYPQNQAIAALFAGLGEPIVARSEAELGAITASSAFMSSYFALQNKLIEHLTATGVPPDQAQAYLGSLLLALSETAVMTPGAERAHLVVEHETPGGLNQRVRRHLEGQGWFDVPAQAFQTVRQLPPETLEN